MTYINELAIKRIKSTFPKEKIKCSEDAAKYLRQFFSDDITIYESFFLLLLNRAGYTIGYVKISQGGVAGTVVDVKIVAKYAIESLASSVILCHNHPSSNLKPSEQDIKITASVKHTLSLFDCTVSDHVILTEDSYFSFADNGHL